MLLRKKRHVTLAQLAPQPKDHFLFEYDFGDGWEHRVAVEAIAAADDPDAIYPRCLAGARACPPENCGGPWGYAELLRQLRDPSDDEHEAMLEWAGRIDPDAFSVEAVNDNLEALTPRQRKAKKEEHGKSKTETQSKNGIMRKGKAKKRSKAKASEPDAVETPRHGELWADESY